MHFGKPYPCNREPPKLILRIGEPLTQMTAFASCPNPILFAMQTKKMFERSSCATKKGHLSVSIRGAGRGIQTPVASHILSAKSAAANDGQFQLYPHYTPPQRGIMKRKSYSSIAAKMAFIFLNVSTALSKSCFSSVYNSSSWRCS